MPDTALDSELLSLLARLTRKGARLDPQSKGYRLCYPGERARQATDIAKQRQIADELVAAAHTRGWLHAESSNGSLRLSETGALALRRGGELPSTIGAPALRMAPAGRVSRSPERPGSLARLASRRVGAGSSAALLSGGQREAAERLARDFMSGQMMPRVTANWDRAALGLPVDRQKGPSSGDISNGAAAAQERVRRALLHVGPEFADLLLDICCLEVGL